MVYLSRHPERMPKLIKDSYIEAIVDHYDMESIRHILGQITFNNSKIVLSGQNIISDGKVNLTVASDILVEKYMKTKYQLFEKPELP